MRAHGGPKPVWITEWGCYADDDPPCVPQTVGDATMNRCRWPSERAATEHIVKFTAVGFAHGVRKIFFHAGTCGTINGSRCRRRALRVWRRAAQDVCRASPR